MGIQPNENFYNEKPTEKPVEKAIPKKMVQKPAKKKKVVKEKIEAKKIVAPKKKDKLTTKHKTVKVSDDEYEELKIKYPVYFSLSDYHKKCLVATNYWRVVNGLPIIEVPPQYTSYHEYFDKRCYEVAKEVKDRNRRMGKEGFITPPPVTEKIEEVIIELETKKVEPEKAIEIIKEKADSKPKELKAQKEKVKEFFKEEKKEAKKEVKEVKKEIKKSGDEPQLSLF